MTSAYVKTSLLAVVVCFGNACIKKQGAQPPSTEPAATPAASPTTASGAPGKHSTGATADCTIWSSSFDGPYKYENNQWGHEKSTGGFEQCLLRRQVAGKTQHGWTWNWPGHDPSVFAYPQIMFGWKPWSGGTPTDPRFPMPVQQAQHVILRYAVETSATGAYNLAPEIWLIEGGQWSSAANSRLITTEVMFWMDYQGGARPAGSIVDTPSLGGVEYELWKMDNMGDRGDGTGWTILTFKSPTIQLEGEIQIHSLLAYLVETGHVNPEHYVASIEFGNEVMGGTGTTWVKRFEVEVKP